ncbi:MAG: GNAT family N-acetyltransferase, partial [Bdellovibrionales bacterium]
TMRKHIENSGGTYEDEIELGRIKDAFTYAQIISLTGRDIGLLKVDRSKNPWHFSQVQVLPEFQNKGIGGHFLRQTIEEAKQANVGIKLTVLKANPSKSLYERFGFHQIGEVPPESKEGYRYLMQWP